MMMPVVDHSIVPVHNNSNISNNNEKNIDNQDGNDNVEEHHVIQQSMSIGTDDDDDDDNDNDDYYSSDDGSSLMGHYNKVSTTTSTTNQNGSFLFHPTKFWTLVDPPTLSSPPRQHLYNYLETTEGFLLNGADRTFHNSNSNTTSAGTTTRSNSSRHYRSSFISGWKCCIVTMILFILISIVAIWETARPHGTNDAASSSFSFPNNNNNNNTIYILPTTHKFKGAPQYSCPIIIGSNNNNRDNVGIDEGEQAFNRRFANRIDIQMIQQDMATFLDTFRDRNIADYMNIGWKNNNYTNVTYHTLKEQMTAWRTLKYIPSLKKTGANILELNCGLGLNLFMTYEIIQQSQQPKDNIRDVHLYGTTTSTTTSTTADESIGTAVTANALLDTILQKEANFVGGGKRGIICPTVLRTNRQNRMYDHNTYDAPDLSFIPDNSFDLVYTSDIPLARDIWDTDLMSNQEFVNRQVDLCRTKDTDWKSSSLYQVSQEQQESIYGRQVAEMIRITKPGNVIAIEHVPMPFCDLVHRNAAASAPYHSDAFYYYSGVGLDPSFWTNSDTHARYQWNDLDVTSIDILMDESSYYDEYNNSNNNATQYHVVMKKVKKR